MSIAPIQTAFSDETERSPRLSLLCGYAQAQGSRPYQQDCLSVIDNGLLAVDAGGQPAPFEAAPETDKGKPKHSLFGIFDGHGSSDYAQHAANTVHDLVVNDPAFAEGNYPVALANSFFKEDKELLEKVHPEEERGGTTATVALIVDGILCELVGRPDERLISLLSVSSPLRLTYSPFPDIVNVGDSRAVLAERGEGTDYFAIRVSQDHKTSLPKEQARLAKSEAVVAQGRVHTKTHSLNMTRALGDFAFKAPKNEKEQDWVSSAPTIVR